MEKNKNILKLIDNHYDKLSKNQKILANYIKENLNIVGFFSIKELSEKTGISIATISRFVKEIEFDGFFEFQKNLSDLLKKNITPMKEIKNFIKENEEKNILKNIIDSNTNILLNTYTEELNNNFNKAIDILSEKKGNIYICASRSSYSVAFYLYFTLKGIKENVYLLSDEKGNISLKLLSVKKEDKLIAISYARYTKFTYNITRFFKEKECKIVSITDNINAPIGLNSDVVLLAKNSEISYSFVGAMTLANSITVALGKIEKEKVLKRMELHDKILLENDIYIS